jgi:hypothetical protein
MKRYYNNNNLDKDPIRSFTPNNMIGFNQPINKLQDDIIVNQITLNRPGTNTSFDLTQMNQPINQLGLKKNTPVFENFGNIPQGGMNKRNYHGNDIHKTRTGTPNNGNDSSYSLKSKGYHAMDDPVINFLPKNNSTTITPLSNNHLNVTNYNNEKHRFNNMSQEIFEKDDEIQKYKNEVYQLQIELNHVKKEKSSMISADTENKLLKDKLNEHYEISRELTSAKHDLKRIQLENKGNDDTIETLKSIIHKQHIQIYSKQTQKTNQIEFSESDEEIESDSDSYEETDTDSSGSDTEDDQPIKKQQKKQPIKKQQKKQPLKQQKKQPLKQPKQQKPVKRKDNIQEKIKEVGIKPTTSPQFTVGSVKKTYSNQSLRNAMVKQNFDPRKIDQTMIKMKITPNTKITKELLNDFLNKLK